MSKTVLNGPILDSVATPTGLGYYKLGTKAPGAPAYIYHGEADTIVPFDLGATLYRAWCALGVSATFEAIPGRDHVGIWLGPPKGIRWLTDQVAGVESPMGCREVG